MARGLLVVTYFFPPVGGVGVQRTLKYATYLPRWGWRPIVLAPRDPAYPLRDPSLMVSLDANLEVHRTLSLEPTRLTRAIRRVVVPGSGSGSAPGAEVERVTGPGRPGSLRRLFRAGASAWSRAWNALLFPDEAIAWLPSALPTAIRLARRGDVDAIYSSSPPVATHVVAGLTKLLTHRPWVADFRDPWVGNPFVPNASALRRRLQARTERWIVNRADAVVLAVESLRDDYRARYPEIADRFVYIPNGYDRTELVDLPAVPPASPERFRIVFAGSLYRQQELEVFLSGLEVLLARRPDLRSRLEMEFVGRVNDANAAVAARHAVSLLGVVSYRGFVPRREALAWMASANALLQLMPAASGTGVFVGGKLLEYLAFERPILAIMPDGDARRLVDGLPGGRTADLDPGAIATALEGLIDHPPAAGAADPAGRFDRSNLAGELARVLDDVVPRVRSPGTR
jgi:glycosyltransferase involved in cell wall biosynthesis